MAAVHQKLQSHFNVWIRLIKKFKVTTTTGVIVNEIMKYCHMKVKSVIKHLKVRHEIVFDLLILLLSRKQMCFMYNITAHYVSLHFP